MPGLKDNLTQILIKNKLISQENLDRAIEVQKTRGGRLSDILVNLGLIKEKDLMIALSQGLGIPPLDLSKLKIDPAVVNLISKEIARHSLILPVSKVGNTLTVAMADPLNIFTIDDLKVLTGLKVNPVITTSQDILKAIDTYYKIEVDKDQIEEIIQGINEPKIELVKSDAIEEPMDSQSLLHLVEDAPVVKITNRFLSEGIKLRASDILFEPMEKKMRVRYRIDGTLTEAELVPKYMYDSIASRIKILSNLDIAEHRLPQDGRFKIMTGYHEVDFRVSILPSVFGEKVALRILDKSTAKLNIEELGFEQEALGRLKYCSHFPHGMILSCGPTGSGKTTSLYSILKFVDSPEKNIVTVEDPVEYQLEGINQVTARPEIGLTFSAALRSILRQDPNIIMIGEIRDFETLDIAMKAALTGHLVLSTLHTTTAPGSIVRILNMGAEPFLVNSCLIAIMAQRLLRRVCLKCRKPYSVPDTLRDQLSMYLPKNREVIIYQAGRCEECFNTGYKGRVGISEFLAMSPIIKKLIANRGQEYEIKEAACSEGMQTLRADGMKKVLAGITTLEEVLKVTVADTMESVKK